MLHFPHINIATVIVLLIVALMIFLAVYSIIRNKKKGKSSCSYFCEGCPNAELCNKKNPSD